MVGDFSIVAVTARKACKIDRRMARKAGDTFVHCCVEGARAVLIDACSFPALRGCLPAMDRIVGIETEYGCLISDESAHGARRSGRPK